MTIFEILEKSASVFASHLAAIHGERKISFKDLYLCSTKVGKYISSLNLEKKSRIAILFENSLEYLIAFFAVFKGGHVAVPLDTSLKLEKINYILSNCQASVLLVQTKYERLLGEILRKNRSVSFLISEKPLRQTPAGFSAETFDHILDGLFPSIEKPLGEPKYHHPDMLDYNLERESAQAPPELAAIFYTSGSTGSPKGVMLSHRNLIANTIATIQYLNLGPKDSVIVILPFYYIYGNSLLLTHILTGGTLVIDNRFLYPETVLDTMGRERVTGFSGVPSNFMILLCNSTFASRKFEHLRYFTQAGGAMAPEVIRKLTSAFPNKEIYIMYGLTEASPRVSYVPPRRLKDKVGSVGIPVPGVRLRILKEDGSEAAVGEEGEIAVSGDNVMLGYWNEPEESKLVLKERWLLTGDLGRKDGEGYFWIVGRKKDIIKAGGNRVSAKEIEECILELVTVAEAAVLGVPDSILGEAIKAFVVPKKGGKPTKTDIQNYCRSRLDDNKVPTHVEFALSLPKYQSGKINKEVLRSQARKFYSETE
jgi:long-chain acyl-CoA synthetase